LLDINPAPRLEDEIAMAVWLASLLALLCVRKERPNVALLLFVIALYPFAGALSLAGL
jgi:hypothetical protein